MKAILSNMQPDILREQFIPDHLFIYIAKGTIGFFNGNKSYTYRTGECCIARKNYLVKFMLNDSTEDFEPVLLCFDQEFLQQYQRKHESRPQNFHSDEAIIRLKKVDLVDYFVQSLVPYHQGVMKLDEAFEDLKYEKLLTILLKTYPELSGIFFDFDPPQKINLEAYMNRNFRFNVSIERFAYLTGRSISAFKRDFKVLFNETPSRWLVKKRLHEAYFLLDKERRKPSEIYLDLGFESLSHFSVAFKKEFGMVPTSLHQ
jgi:AraC-like DNA-binding protein